MIKNLKETKAAVYDLLMELHMCEACEILMGSVNEEYRQSKLAKHSFEFRKKLHALNLNIQNTSNAMQVGNVTIEENLLNQ